MHQNEFLPAEIVSIGDEITSGAILDTNGQWISQQLGLLGIPIDRHTSVADNLSDMIHCFQDAAKRSSWVIVTGGLGPTADDLTRQAVCQAFGGELEFDQASWDHVENLFRRRNRIPTENNRIQAMFPAGSRIVPNPNGTAPGIHWTVPTGEENQHECDFWCFPGVPSELKSMWAETAFPQISQRLGSKRKVIKKFTVKTFGSGESEVEQKLGDLIQRGNDPIVGITASLSTISLRIQALGISEEQCDQKINRVVQRIENSLGNLVFGYQDQELEDVFLDTLAQSKNSVAIAEWGTGGYLSQLLSFSQQQKTHSNEPKRVFLGGVVIPDLQHLQSDVLKALQRQKEIQDDRFLSLADLKTSELDEETFSAGPSDENGKLFAPSLTDPNQQKSRWLDYSVLEQASLLSAAAKQIAIWKGSSVGIAAGPLFEDRQDAGNPKFLVSYWFKDHQTLGPFGVHFLNRVYFSGGPREIRVIRAAKQILNEIRLLISN